MDRNAANLKCIEFPWNNNTKPTSFFPKVPSITLETHCENISIAEMFTAESYSSSSSDWQTNMENYILNFNEKKNFKDLLKI